MNRILTWGRNGIRYEADQKHAVMLVNENLTSKDRPVSTQGEDRKDSVNESEMSAPEEIRSFRANAARVNFLSMDRPEPQFSAKEMSRAMLKPTKKDQRRMTRMATSLKDPEKQRVQQECKV